jgi:hypothetical protein
MYRILIFLFIFQWSYSGLQAQHPGTWNILNVRYPLNSKWTVFSEGQIRSLSFYNNFHYHELGGGVIYRPSRRIALTLAGGEYLTYSEGGNFVSPVRSDEFRIWPQLTINQSFGRLILEHRYRSEFRFVTSGFRMRFRSRLGATLPLNRREIEPGTIYLGASEELFFTNKAPYFERNRVILLVGRQFSKSITIHLGYVHQFDYRINDETGSDFVQVSLQTTLGH